MSGSKEKEDLSKEVSSWEHTISQSTTVTPSSTPAKNPSTVYDTKHMTYDQMELHRQIRWILVESTFRKAHYDCEVFDESEIPVKYRKYEVLQYEDWEGRTRSFRSPIFQPSTWNRVPLSHHCCVESECRSCYSCSLCGRSMCVDVYRNYEGKPCMPVAGPLCTTDHLLLDDYDHIWSYLTKHKENKEKWNSIYEQYRRDDFNSVSMRMNAQEVADVGVKLWSREEFLEKLEFYHNDFGIDEDFYLLICEKVREIV